MAALAAALAALVLAACGGGAGGPDVGGSEQFKIPEIEAEGELRRLIRKENEILDGGADAFETRLDRLRGHPVVVNQWASWCGPCRFEFPIFRRLAIKYGGRVAFIGVNSEDSRDAAETFLRDTPMPYPHYFDPDAEIARSFGGGRAWPTTAFYNSEGDLTWTHQGVYPDRAALADHIETYALERGS